MTIGAHIGALWQEAHWRISRWILAHRIRARHPTLICDPTAIWDYGFHDIAAIEIGKNVSVLAHVEIVVRKRAPHSNIEGRLVLCDGAVIGAGANIRAAGGEIHLGKGSGIGQNGVVVAANHAVKQGELRLHTPWDETRCHVFIGDNVWIGANSVVLPGCRIGDNAVIGAGSVVTSDIPPNELWAGVPARKIKALEPDVSQSA